MIIASLVPQLLNWVLVGPMTTNVMIERHRLEKLELKEYDEPNVSGPGNETRAGACLTSGWSQPSEAMSKVNTKFSTLHGISSGLNTIAFVALAGLGLALSM